MQRHLERPVLRDLKLQRAEIAPLDLQQRLLVVDLFDQQLFVHRFYHSLKSRGRRGNNGAAGDPDGDGVSNLDEWLVGMNPQLADRSAFPQLGIEKIMGGYRVSFPTIPGRLYQLQVSGTLDGWVNSGSPISTAGDPGPDTLEIDDTSGLQKRFYRMIITPSP